MSEKKLSPFFVVNQHDSEKKDINSIGLSLNGYNPNKKDFIEMPLESAERLKARLDFMFSNAENLLYRFWQRSSDACPVESNEEDYQVREFVKFVRDSFII